MSKRAKYTVFIIIFILISCLCSVFYLKENPFHPFKPVRTERKKDTHFKSTGNNHMKSEGTNHYKSTGSNHYK